MSDSKPKSRARQRYERRKKRDVMTTPTRQAASAAARPARPRDRERPRRPKTDMRIPAARWLFFVPFGMLIVVGVIVLLRILNPPPPEPIANAIWLNTDWTYEQHSDSDYIDLFVQLRDHRIGTVYAYVSSLNADGTWAGFADRSNQFNEAEPFVRAFVQRFNQVYPDAQLYAWIEVRATTPDGYRLDDLLLQRTIADFSARAIDRLGFDGVFLDVKPVFDNNDDFLTLMRTVRATIGLDLPMAVAVPPDFTPIGAGINVPDVIAPNTIWSVEYKQRVALQADQLVVTAYNSYLDNAPDYLNWVTYQVLAYHEALSNIDTGSNFLISIPNYPPIAPVDGISPHWENAETMAAALDGVNQALQQLENTMTDDDAPSPFQGVAIFSDDMLTDDEWALYRDKWLE